MIRKLRLKFVAICMALVTVVLAVVFGAVYLALEQNMEQISRQVLHRVIQEERLPVVGPGMPNRPDLGISIGGERVQLPYFTVNVWGSTAYITGGTYANLEDTEVLQTILDDCLRQNSSEGTISAYHLRYLRQENGAYEKIAFVDMSMELAMIGHMMRSYLAIGALALALLLAVSILLSWWVTRPVDRAWKQQRQFLSDASHELKTPLTVILSNAEMLEGTELTGKSERWLDNIHSEAQQMKSLVEQMLTLARADNAVPTAVMAEVNFSDLTLDCVLAFESVAFEAGKELVYDISENILLTGDSKQLRQLISILLDNAVKYGAAGEPIHLSLQRTERQAKLTVSNAGTPIPPEQLKRLFERFYRADDSRGEQSGFGLGLPIAAAIASEHKAALKAESDSVSTRFLFTAPLKK